MAAGLATWHGYEEAMASYRREIRNLGITLAEQTARSMQAVDLVLQEIQAKVATGGIRTPGAAEVTDGNRTSPSVPSRSIGKPAAGRRDRFSR